MFFNGVNLFFVKRNEYFVVIRRLYMIRVNFN